jgi:peptidoglycan hydrolase CwlO-like protein
MRELDHLATLRADMRREGESLRHSIKDLNRALERYREESARLEEEREILQDKSDELEALIAKRDEEIAEMEGMLGDKERIIA